MRTQPLKTSSCGSAEANRILLQQESENFFMACRGKYFVAPGGRVDPWSRET